MTSYTNSDILATVYSIRHGSGYRMILECHYHIISDNTYAVPLRGSTLYSAMRAIAQYKLVPYSGDTSTLHTLAHIVGNGAPSPLLDTPYKLLPTCVVADPYHLTVDMCRWLGIPDILAGVYTGNTGSWVEWLPVRI